MSNADPYLSVVLPVHRGAAYIEASVEAVVDTLEQTLGSSFEVIVVVDGNLDRTREATARIRHPAVSVYHYPQNQGKGFALSLGTAQARGRLIGWLDADMDIAPDALVRAARLLEADEADAVVGSKRHPDSDVDYPLRRRIYSSGFQALIRALFRFSVRDTQVGVKVFRREMLDTVLPLLLIKRYAFDVEVLAVGAAFGFDRIREVPIRLAYRFSGTGIDWRAVGRMGQDTLAIAYRIHVRHWYVRRWAALHRARLDDESPAQRVPLPAPLAADHPPQQPVEPSPSPAPEEAAG